MRILSSGLILIVFLFGCASRKKEVSNSDLKRLIERIAIVRFTEHLEADDLPTIKSDYKIFIEACDIFRLDPEQVMQKIQISYPDLYNTLKNEHEK